jgi:hypothetical protein
MQGDMPKRTSLEDDLAALTQEFVGRIVATLRNASFGDVAALAPTTRATVTIPRPNRAPPAASKSSGRTRRGPVERAAIVERVAETLRKAGEPLGVRALSSELGVAADKLAAPLKELRDAGRVKKHGDKRATTYSAT